MYVLMYVYVVMNWCRNVFITPTLMFDISADADVFMNVRESLWRWIHLCYVRLSINWCMFLNCWCHFYWSYDVCRHWCKDVSTLHYVWCMMYDVWMYVRVDVWTNENRKGSMLTFIYDSRSWVFVISSLIFQFKSEFILNIHI